MQSEGADAKRRDQRWGLIPRAGFLLIGTTDFEGRLILCRRELLVPCRLLSGIPGLYPLDASGSLQLWQQELSPDTDTRLLGGQTAPRGAPRSLKACCLCTPTTSPLPQSQECRPPQAPRDLCLPLPDEDNEAGKKGTRPAPHSLSVAELGQEAGSLAGSCIPCQAHGPTLL